MTMHYSGSIRTRNKIVRGGWAACCSGWQTEKLLADGKVTRDPTEVTCKRCQNLIALHEARRMEIEAAQKGELCISDDCLTHSAKPPLSVRAFKELGQHAWLYNGIRDLERELSTARISVSEVRDVCEEIKITIYHENMNEMEKKVWHLVDDLQFALKRRAIAATVKS